MQTHPRLSAWAAGGEKAGGTTACSGNAFYGPDGTGQTFFSEFHNNSTPSTGTGTVRTGLPIINVPDFGFSLPSRRYVQYRMHMESDDATQLCSAGTASCMPELFGVSVGPDHYPRITPITYNVAIPFYTLDGFSESVTCLADVRYQLSTNGSSWHYHNGTTWTGSDGTLSQSSTAATINSHAASFDSVVGSSTLYVKALLPSDGTQSCEVNGITISGNTSH